VRPTVSEQLAGVRRILAEVIAPEVTGAYPVDMLRGVLANLEMLERSWMQIGPFLVWDNAGTERVLEHAAAVVDDETAARVRAALVAAPTEADAAGQDVDALEAHNTVLRGLLAEIVPQLAGGGEPTAAAYAELRAHLRERIGRFPLTMNAPMPGAAR
jgi:hypothetical protein